MSTRTTVVLAERLTNLPIDRYVRIVEGRGRVE
jgi:hypothetical protein